MPNPVMEANRINKAADELLLSHETPSEIKSFYRGSVIFLTGGSGFIGNVMIEKILRTCPDIFKIYLLIRPKKGKDSQQRLEEMFKGVFFEQLQLENPKFQEKVCLIEGDCEQPDLGISEVDRQTLIENVNIVFHVAATVRFNETIRKATYINVRGTRDLMLLSQKMRYLKALVYVSTVFSNCNLSEVDEMFYNLKMDGDKLINIVDLLDDAELDTLTPNIIGKWPNTYTYSKAIAENVVRQYGQSLPVSIVRPSIVVSTYKEPIPGWINNIYGPVGITIGAGIGFLRTLHCNPDNIADLVPVDYCVNAILTSAWVAGQLQAQSQEVKNTIAFDDLKIEENIPIFNYISAAQNPITWRRYMYLCEYYGLQIPSNLCVWYYCFYLNPNKYMHLCYVLFLHYIPGTIFDTCLYISGRKPMLMKTYKKIQKFSNVLTYFTLKKWTFKNENTQAMWNKLNTTDKSLFEFDMSLVVWKNYFSDSVRGGRVHLLKDPLDTVPQATKRYKILKIVHYTVVTVFCLVLLRIIWMVIGYIF